LSTPSRYEVEHLHRLMLQASQEAANLDKRVAEAQKKDSLGGLLKLWQEAGAGVESTFSRAKAALERDGTPSAQTDRIEKRLKDLREKSVHFDLHADLDACVEHWKTLGQEFAQLSGKQRDSMVDVLDRYKPQVDRATSGLSSALRSEGMLPDEYLALKSLREQRDGARQKYERLRQQYLAKEKDWQAAEQQKAHAEKGGASQVTQQGKFPVVHTGARAPVVVRLPTRLESKDPKKLDPKLHLAPPPKLPPKTLPPDPKKVQPPPLHRPQPHKPEQKLGKPLPHKPEPPKRKPEPPKLGKAFPHKLGIIRPSQVRGQHKPEPKAPPTATVTQERIERVAPYPEGIDGIGRGAQTAHIYFRAQGIDHALRITGTISIQLGCAVRLDVAPSVQLFAARPGMPLQGKVSLGLASSGGVLGPVTPKNALNHAVVAARNATGQVVAKMGVIGDRLSSAIREALEDAAEKIFLRAHSARHVEPAHPRHVPRKQVVEHHVGRFGHSLGHIVHQARSVQGGQEHKHQLHKILDHDHHRRSVVANRLEDTLSHLATATHRTLTDPNAGELRGHLARIDSILARVHGKAGQELADGAHEIGQILSRMGSLASHARGGASHIATFQRLIDERRNQLLRVLGHGRGKPEKPAHSPRHHLPAPQHAGHKALHDLRRYDPALDKLLKNASTAHLAHELAKAYKGGLHSLADKPGKHPAHAGGLGTMALGGLHQSLGGGHLGGFGGGHRPAGLSATTGVSGALAKVLHKQFEHQVQRGKPHEVAKLLGDLHKAPKGSPLHDLAQHAETRRKQHAVRAAVHKGPPPAHITAGALQDAFRDHPKGKAFAAHLAKGGPLAQLCETAQRGRGLPVGHAASHFLAARGHSHLYNTVNTFHSLTKQGHEPHFWSLKSVFHGVTNRVSSAFHAVTNTVSNAARAATSFASNPVGTVRAGISNVAHAVSRFVPSPVRNLVQRGVGMAKGIAQQAGTFVKHQAQQAWQTAKHMGHQAFDQYKQVGLGMWNMGQRAFHNISGGIAHGARRLWGAVKRRGGGLWGGIKRMGHGLSHLYHQGLHAAQSGTSWLQGKVGGAFDFAKGLAGKGIDFINKTGVVGAVSGMVKKGLSTAGSLVSSAWKHSPLGIAVSKGWGMVKSPLGKIWDKTKSVAGKAWEGIKKGYKATAGFLQSPAGQLLVTGLSLAASFIPGGILVKALVGGAIGAIQAISEGKDLKGILLGAGSGALTGALPFLKLGPLAKIGVGALTGGLTTLAQGGSLKDALKGAAGGAVDAFDPGAMKSLGKLKGFSAAGKILSGGKMNAAEKALVQGSKFAGPLRGLEKAMTNPRFRKTVGALEKVGGKAIKGGIWVSGKAAKAQSMLDKVVGVGDKIHGALEQVHQYAPEVAGMLGDNAAGHFVSNLGDLSGKADDKLAKALEYGHGASDKLTTYRGYLDKGLGMGGVKDPAKAYERMMARRGAARGRRGSSEDVARHKLERHRERHPELHPRQTEHRRGWHVPSFWGQHSRGHGALERAIARGHDLQQKGLRVTRGVHDKLGTIHHVVGKGLATAGKVQSGLEKASALAKQGAGIFGEDSELGRFLLHASDKADQVHGYLEQGIGLAQGFNDKVGSAHGALGHVHGMGEKSPLHGATHLQGQGKGKQPQHGTGVKRSPHDPPVHKPVASGETEEQKKQRHSHAYQKLTSVSTDVNMFEKRYGKTMPQIREMLAKGKTHEASLELMGLGSHCDSVSKSIQEALALSKGNPNLEKEAKFYADWHKQMKAKLHGVIADTKGLGDHAQITGFGFSESTHPDIFQNTREIYAVQAKVIAFGDSLSDTDSHEQVKKVLAEARKAKADLQALKGKYKSDKKARDFLSAGGQQDKLIDDSIKKLEAALKGESHEPGKPHPGKIDPHKKPGPEKKKPADLMNSVEGGLKAIDRYRRRAVKTGRKVDHSLTRVEHALNKGIKIGKKVDHGLAKIAGLADQVSQALGEDTPMGALAHEVSQDAGAGHDKLHQTLNAAAKGKSFLHTGHQLFHQGLQIAAGHHERMVTAVHGKHGSPRLPEHLHHVSPHGPINPEADQVLRDGRKMVHGAEHLWKGGQHAAHDADKMWKDARRAGHEAQHMWKDARHFGHGASHMWGDVKKMVHGDHKHLGRDIKHLFGEGKHLFGEGKHLFGEGKHLWGRGQKLWGEGKHLVEEGKGLLGEGKDLAQQGGHLVEDISHLLHKGKDWVHGNLPNLDLSGVAEQAKKAWNVLPEWLKGIFGGGGKPSPHHRPGVEPAPAQQLSEADVAALVQGAQGLVTEFGSAVTRAIKEIEKLMQAGDTKSAGDRVEGMSHTSEQARSQVTRAVSASAKYPALHKTAVQASKHYLEIRGHFFKFVSGLHGLAGKATELEGVDAKKYPDLAEISTDISSLQVKVDALGQLKHADTPMQGMVKELQKEASSLRHRLSRARAAHKSDKAALTVVGGLSAKLMSIESQLGSHGAKGNVQKGDQDLGVERHPGPPPKKPRKRPSVDDDARIHVDRGGARGDTNVQDQQDVDAAAADTWIGSGEGVKNFSEVFGAFLPAEGALVHHRMGEKGGDWHEWHTGGDDPVTPSHHRRRRPAVIHGHGTGWIPDHEDPHGHPTYRRHKKKGGFFHRIVRGVSSMVKGVKGFFKGLFDHLESFSDTVGGWAKKGADLLGQGMHFAEMGMHGLSAIEKAAAKVQGIAGKAEGFLNKIGFGKAAGFASKIGGAAGWVDEKAKFLHGGLKTADQWMGKGKQIAGQVEGGAEQAHGMFDQAAHGRFGTLVSLFKSSRTGDIGGKLEPEKVRVGSMMDEPRRLDIATISRMEGFLGGDFAGVRLHVGPGAADITRRFNAEAVTVKDHIFFAPGRFNPQSMEGQRLLAHELTHVMQKGRKNLDVRTAEGEAMHSEHSYGAPQMETLNLSQPQTFRLGDGEGMGNASGVHTAKRNRSRGHDSGGLDTSPPDGEDFLEQISGRVYELLMEELEHSFESR
jgi:hypothetical protein